MTFKMVELVILGAAQRSLQDFPANKNGNYANLF